MAHLARGPLVIVCVDGHAPPRHLHANYRQMYTPPPFFLSAEVILLIYGPGMSRTFFVLCSRYPPLFFYKVKVKESFV